MSTEHIATLKRGRGGLAINKKDAFSKLRKDADRKRLFCPSVSTLLSMIEAFGIRFPQVISVGKLITLLGGCSITAYDWLSIE